MILFIKAIIILDNNSFISPQRKKQTNKKCFDQICAEGCGSNGRFFPGLRAQLLRVSYFTEEMRNNALMRQRAGYGASIQGNSMSQCAFLSSYRQDRKLLDAQNKYNVTPKCMISRENRPMLN